LAYKRLKAKTAFRRTVTHGQCQRVHADVTKEAVKSATDNVVSAISRLAVCATDHSCQTIAKITKMIGGIYAPMTQSTRWRL